MPTNPGYHPDVNLTPYPRAIIKAIQQVAKSFYVTRSFQPVWIGNSEYWALLVRPKDEFSVYINTDREIVVLFSTYDTFEIRTLEAFDEIYATLESKRVDRSVRFLISGDNKIEGVVKHYLDQNPEYPIIIPVTIDALSFARGNHLLEAIRRNYLIRDLFGYQNPLREETFFFGRQDVVNTVLDMSRSSQNSTLFGLRKSGKTSAIYAIQRKARGFGATAVVIDCQNPTVHARPFNLLLSYVIAQVKQAIGQSGAVPTFSSEPASVSEDFTQHMKSALGSAKSNILLIFDEIENISPGTAASDHWRSGNDPVFFWQTIRSFIQLEKANRLSICLVGTSPHILEMAKINGIDNPIYLFAPKRFIPNLSFDETKEMVQRLGYFMGLDFTSEQIASLQKAFGGHPFFTRQVCSLVHQQASASRPLEVSKKALDDAVSNFSGQLESYLKDILEHLQLNYPEEFNLLRSIVEGSSAETAEYMRDAPDLIDHLIGYELIRRVGDDVEIKFDSIEPALKRLFPNDPNSPEARWTELVKRRNRIENAIRQELYFWSRGVEASDWNALLERALTRKRYEALETHEPRSLFSPDRSPLYLSDLIMLLKDGSPLPYLAMQKSEITTALDNINKLRRDAHARNIQDTEMQEVRKSFEFLEGVFPGI